MLISPHALDEPLTQLPIEIWYLAMMHDLWSFNAAVLADGDWKFNCVFRTYNLFV